MLRDQSFDAPIPGMALTHELGARPWQTPAKYSNVDDAIEYYLDRMSQDEFIEQLEDILEMGVPITSIANALQLGNVMEGIHNIDIGMLILPVLMEMMMTIGDSAGIKYDTGLSKKAPLNEKRTRSTLVLKTARKLQKKLNEQEKIGDIEQEQKEEPIEEKEEQKPKGLMGRRK